MAEPEKITIIEGPSPRFEISPESWLPAVAEGPYMPQVATCRLRTPNGPALVERCYRAWREHRPVHLEYRSFDGLTQEAHILGARNVEVDEGDLLLLWVRLPEEEVELHFDFSEFSDDDPVDDDDLDLPDLFF